jgi:hypothetical protein
VRKFIETSGTSGVFEPETIIILVGAFDDAWKAVEASGAEYTNVKYSTAAREILAIHIIAAAKEGELNRQQLSQGALLHLSRANLKFMGQ